MPIDPHPSNAPDTKPSRGGDYDDKEEEVASTSTMSKRKSNSRGSGGSSRRRSSHKRSSSTASSSKEEKRRSSTSKDSSSPRRSSRSPHRSRRSSHSRSSASSGKTISNNKTPDSSKSNDEKLKLRLIEADGTIIHSPPLSSVAGATTVNDSSGHRRSSKTPDSKNKEKQKLRLAEANENEIHSPMLSSSPAGAVAASSKSSHGRSRKSSKFSSSRNRTTPDSSKNKNKSKHGGGVRLADGGSAGEIRPPPLLDHQDMNNDRPSVDPTMENQQQGMPTIKATTAPDVEEMIEEARQQGRQEGRQERLPQGVVGEVVMEQTSAKKKHRYAIALVIFLILAGGGGVTAWQLLGNPKGSTEDSSLPSQDTKNAPSKEDCLAVSKGIVPPGEQNTNNETDAKVLGMEIDLAVSSDVDVAFLQKELELRMQQNVLPALVGCPTDTPLSVENINVNTVAVILNTISVGDPVPCNKDSSEELVCSKVYFEMDLFSFKGGDEPDEDLMADVLKDLFQDEGLLELLNLKTAVEGVYFNYVKSQRLPSSSPSITISEPPVDVISDNDCLNIAEGESVDGQQDLVLQEYDIFMDVMLGVATNNLTTVSGELEENLQRFLMPALVGCTHNSKDHPLGTEGLILNAVVEAEYLVRGVCLPESDPPCYRYGIHLDIFVRRIVASADFTATLMTLFRELPLVPRLGLLSPFVRITVVDGVAQTPSAAPSVSPSSNPTTQTPSHVPSVVPSTSPSQILSTVPSPQPTPRPTDQTSSPTPGPTKFPTVSPTKFPTLSPTTKSPTKSPTTSPTVATTPTPTTSLKPTSSPTRTCILSNDALTTARDNWFSNQPVVEAQYGPIGDWCFGPSVTSMVSLFEGKSTFNEDISKWDVSGITTMASMFSGADAFNQDIGGWNVSSVTNMVRMFSGADDFNQDVADWNVSSVAFMSQMFYEASNFNQNLCAWDDHLQIDMRHFRSIFYGTNCPTTADPGFVDGPFCHTC